MNKKMKKVIKFVEKVIRANEWDVRNLSWHYYPGPRREHRGGRCRMNVELEWSEKEKDFVICRTAKKRTSISVYANDEVEAVFLSGHELFHYLAATNQLKRKLWKPTDYFANIFGLIVLMKFLKEVGMIEKCPNCGSAEAVVKYNMQSQFSVVVDLSSPKVLEMPHVEKIGKAPQDFLVVCENCGTEIEIDEEQRSRIVELLSVYNFGLME
ncbi:unnamed protein product [marine sediment metagenome]|uniref:Uncharacterized protein n=1 Tax=marine sediment metagenome TaxID=412755 RepID=X1HMT2_9ZZZZ